MDHRQKLTCGAPCTAIGQSKLNLTIFARHRYIGFGVNAAQSQKSITFQKLSNIINMAKYHNIIAIRLGLRSACLEDKVMV